MWWREDLVRQSVPLFVDLLRSGKSFESATNRHKVNGSWVLVVSFQYVDCDGHAGGLYSHVITEGLFRQAVRCAEARGGISPGNVAAQLYGVMEAEEAEEDQEAARP